ncbi:hypothetical protein [Nocardioides sp. TF02-7]|uniref:hypothetical protein n=1 Tax=Nocardioides sp. TF02-7 TaxID=2917724 RepID=UPI001F050737|nr:hypothetical protein [Nocardioides sp. TF02-7]UMG93592.1 hypothetical protein MF408_05215 [Nocardioides sp. TF02-7]
MGYAGFALLLGPTTPYWQLLPFLAVATTGAGATMLPTITMATRTLDDPDIPSGTTMINVLNQLATSVTTAAVAVVLATALSSRLPATVGDGIGDLQALPTADRAAVAPQVSEAMQVALALPVAMMAAALVVAVVVFRRPPR